MACDLTDLANDASCIEATLPPQLYLPVLIVLAQQIAGNTQTPAELVADAACLAETIPPGAQLPVLINLSCDS